eukprot:61301-Rhodomonas_salina.1
MLSTLRGSRSSRLSRSSLDDPKQTCASDHQMCDRLDVCCAASRQRSLRHNCRRPRARSTKLGPRPKSGGRAAYAPSLLSVFVFDHLVSDHFRFVDLPCFSWKDLSFSALSLARVMACSVLLKLVKEKEAEGRAKLEALRTEHDAALQLRADAHNAAVVGLVGTGQDL